MYLTSSCFFISSPVGYLDFYFHFFLSHDKCDSAENTILLCPQLIGYLQAAEVESVGCTEVTGGAAEAEPAEAEACSVGLQQEGLEYQ